MRSAARKSLLLGTALASTLLLGTLLAPAPVHAAVNCPPGTFPPPGPIAINNPADDIVCVNVFDRYNNAGDTIHLSTNGVNEYIYLNNSGVLTASNVAGEANAIYALTSGNNSPIEIVNSGDLVASTTGAGANAFGIYARTQGITSTIGIVNSGDIEIVTTGANADAYGIYALTQGISSTIGIWNSGDIELVTNSDLAEAFGIFALTAGATSTIGIDNSGDIAIVTNGAGADAFGIRARAIGATNSIGLENSGNIELVTNGDSSDAFGIFAYTTGATSTIGIENSGDIETVTDGADADTAGIYARTTGITSPIGVENHGDIALVTAGEGSAAAGIYALTQGISSTIGIENSGDMEIVTTGDLADAAGIYARTDGSTIGIENSGDITLVTAGEFADAFGIAAITAGATSAIGIENSGDIAIVTAGDGADAAGIAALTSGATSPIGIENSGDVALTTTGDGADARGISVTTSGVGSPIDIWNSGDFVVTSTSGYAIGINATTSGDNSSLHIDNSGNLTATTASANLDAIGIRASTSNIGPIDVMNAGDITAIATGSDGDAYGIFAVTFGSGRVDVWNSGDIVVSTVGATASAYGIRAATTSGNSPLLISSSGNVVASGPNSFGIFGSTDVATSSLRIENSGSAFGGTAGIVALSDATSTIVNSGYVSATSLLAIQSRGPGGANVYNSGTIFGFVLLDADDTMINQAGGTFEARLTSDFDAGGAPLGNDLLRNESGGTVHALQVNGMQPTFINLERFENRGLISTVNGNVDEVFTIANVLGDENLQFAASGNSALAVDAFLGPPGSTADNFIIDGNVTGKTQVLVNNTRPGGGVFNPDGIPFAFVNGDVNANAFFMPQPFDSGLFDWDVFFVPTGSGFFELRSFPGGGAHQLPQLLTAAQDVWHSTSETWFDRTADLRVLLNGGAAYGASGSLPSGTGFAPGVWLKGSGTWLQQDDSATTNAQGRTYRYNLNRDLDLWNLQGGMDFGKKGMWAEGDALLFGLLGGVVQGVLDYDHLLRRFDIEGGEVGGYVTYLSGGLFVDTLVKVDFLEFENEVGAPGLPGSLDSTAWGFRTDAGYRFGQFRRGPFIEPLATIAVVWAEMDDYALGGNRVTFDDEANVRGRLGLRVGTSHELWPAIVMEPFVIGSVWSNLSGDNQATVTSLGTSFGPFTDEPDDLWGVVSAGVNFFSPGANTSLFGKVDVAFGDETEGVSARGGMRYNW